MDLDVGNKISIFPEILFSIFPLQVMAMHPALKGRLRGSTKLDVLRI